MIYIIGIGPGDEDYLVPAAIKTAAKCQVLVGGSRAHELFLGDQERYIVTGDLEGLKNFLSLRLAEGKNVGVLVSGDPGYYSLLPYIKRHFSATQLEVIPGISSLQFAFARAREAWQEAILVSAHGRPLEDISRDPAIMLGVLTGKENNPQRVAEYLLACGVNRKAFVGENLSYAHENWTETDLRQLAIDEFIYTNAVVLIMPAEGELK